MDCAIHIFVKKFLQEIIFKASIVEPYIWSCLNEVLHFYNYIEIYIRLLTSIFNNWDEIIKNITKQNRFKLKSTERINCHLGINFYRDEDIIILKPP